MHIVVPDDFPPTYASLDQPDLRRLADYGTSVVLHTTRAQDRPELFERLRDAEAIINVRAYTVLDDEALGMAPKLRMISILGTGTDNVDLAAAKRRGIVVTNTPGTGATSVAELTLGLLLAVVRAIPISGAGGQDVGRARARRNWVESCAHGTGHRHARDRLELQCRRRSGSTTRCAARAARSAIPTGGRGVGAPAQHA
jgi:hypothetical protein